MADILIRGMKTLKEPTPLTLYPEGRWNDYTDGANGEFLSLPDEYGRLGDLDALEKELAFDYAYAAAKVCHNAPTIIPAKAENAITTREELFAAVRLIIKNCKEQIVHDCNECALYDYCFDGMPFFGRAPCNWPDPEEGGGEE